MMHSNIYVITCLLWIVSSAGVPVANNSTEDDLAQLSADNSALIAGNPSPFGAVVGASKETMLDTMIHILCRSVLFLSAHRRKVPKEGAYLRVHRPCPRPMLQVSAYP